jgi:hypothetical protein
MLSSYRSVFYHPAHLGDPLMFQEVILDMRIPYLISFLTPQPDETTAIITAVR